MILEYDVLKYIDDLISKSSSTDKYILVNCSTDIVNIYRDCKTTILKNGYVLSSPFGTTKNVYLLGIPNVDISLVSYSKLTKEQFDNVISGYNITL